MREYLYLLATDRKKGFVAAILKIILLILSLVYGVAVVILSFLHRLKPYRIKCKVISVGNITLGGTGKTPLVELLAVLLKDKGHKIAILSRGYKRKITNYQLPVTNYENMGDEPYMLSRKLVNVPVIVDSDRIKSSRKAIKDYGVDTVILDDGFQQWGIAKDLDIVVIDTLKPFGNRHLLPRGILREPLSSLRRAGIIVLSKVNLDSDRQNIASFLSGINPKALIVEAIYKPLGFYRFNDQGDNLFDAGQLQNKGVGLLCGIADPGSFEDLIKSLGINPAASFCFPDHHDYSVRDLEGVIRVSQAKNIQAIITTEKDAVRLGKASALGSRPDIFVLRISLEILQNEIFSRRIHSLY